MVYIRVHYFFIKKNFLIYFSFGFAGSQLQHAGSLISIEHANS